MNGDKFIYRGVPYSIIPHVDTFEGRVNRQYSTDGQSQKITVSVFEEDEEVAVERVKQAIDHELDGH